MLKFILYIYYLLIRYENNNEIGYNKSTQFLPLLWFKSDKKLKRYWLPEQDLHTIDSLQKRAVVLLRTASAIGRVLALSDGTLYLADSETLVANAIAKNVSSFCVNENPSHEDPFTLEVKNIIYSSFCWSIFTRVVFTQGFVKYLIYHVLQYIYVYTRELSSMYLMNYNLILKDMNHERDNLVYVASACWRMLKILLQQYFRYVFVYWFLVFL